MQTNIKDPLHLSYLKYVCDKHLVTHRDTNSNLPKVVKVGCCTKVMILWIAVPVRQEMSVPLEINQDTTEILY